MRADLKDFSWLDVENFKPIRFGGGWDLEDAGGEEDAGAGYFDWGLGRGLRGGNLEKKHLSSSSVSFFEGLAAGKGKGPESQPVI